MNVEGKGKTFDWKVRKKERENVVALKVRRAKQERQHDSRGEKTTNLRANVT